ncbi:hypothetical protein ETD86_26435 [Nonomuraea turkmeniaca]|uniref:Uncharacterized protein n=1 Tax=Nonomuraea turkmeniaca TaxID=103838 RepID=A0A5S4FXA7_9ACTN|nr:hypothetical protein [Nonomuraea turkmeniaca]TMR15803.1 hypothetical protein ETD86_26435 [Nonomuraea turkmeniaca]
MRERRFATRTDRAIANEIAADAQRTGRGVAVEELAGIRDRVRLWPSQRTAWLRKIAPVGAECGADGGGVQPRP